MMTVADIFDQLGGPTAVARLLEVGPSTASEMKRRGSIPPEHWVRLVTGAERRGHAVVTYETLALAHAKAKGRAVPSKAGAAA